MDLNLVEGQCEGFFGGLWGEMWVELAEKFPKDVFDSVARIFVGKEAVVAVRYECQARFPRGWSLMRVEKPLYSK